MQGLNVCRKFAISSNTGLFTATNTVTNKANVVLVAVVTKTAVAVTKL